MGQARGASVEFWCLKALAQLFDIVVHHHTDAAVLEAAGVLLKGAAAPKQRVLSCNAISFSSWLYPAL